MYGFGWNKMSVQERVQRSLQPHRLDVTSWVGMTASFFCFSDFENYSESDPEAFALLTALFRYAFAREKRCVGPDSYLNVYSQGFCLRAEYSMTEQDAFTVLKALFDFVESAEEHTIKCANARTERAVQNKLPLVKEIVSRYRKDIFENASYIYEREWVSPSSD